jgi:hypothetical protein
MNSANGVAGAQISCTGGQGIQFFTNIATSAGRNHLSIRHNSLIQRWSLISLGADLITKRLSHSKRALFLSNLDEMNVYVKPTLYWTEEDELPVDEEGNPTVAVGDVKARNLC